MRLFRRRKKGNKLKNLETSLNPSKGGTYHRNPKLLVKIKYILLKKLDDA